MKVKICGLTHSEDAAYAAQQGADYIGINFAHFSKRCVALLQARDIAQASRANGAVPVGIFVDESVEQIHAICKETGITTIQLHGEK